MGFGRDDTGKLAIRITGAGKTKPQVPDLIWPARDPMFRLIRTTADAGADLSELRHRVEELAKAHPLYPGGEGCGYAGGIVSSAIDGLRIAEQIAAELS